MLKKFRELRNIGKFVDFHATGDTELRTLNLVFGENGRGKTTLCGVLRSLATGDETYIAERKTLGAAQDPYAQIIADPDICKFNKNAWDNTIPNLAVFDSCFVHDNVYSGEHVDHEHKKNLHRVIVGKQGVQLNATIVTLDAEIREYSKELRSLKPEIEKSIPAGVAFEEFRSLQVNHNVDAEIAAAAIEVAAAKRAEDIAKAKILSTITLPELPDQLQATLSKTLEDVSAEVEQQIRIHLGEHTNGATEQWVEEGTAAMQNETCPYCGQSTKDIDIVDAYRNYFGKAYSELKSEITRLRAALNQSFSPSANVSREAVLHANEQSFDFWKEFIDIDSAPSLPEDCDPHAIVKGLGDAVQLYVSRKVNGPLEAIQLGTDYSEAKKRFETLMSAVDDYNSHVLAINEAINKSKAETASGDLAERHRKLAILEATKNRHQPDCIALCEKYSDTSDAKDAAELTKEGAREKLNAYSFSIFGKYLDRINELLDSFQASFRLAELKPQYTGGQPSSTYEIMIRSQRVPVGDPSKPRGRPRFGCTLSNGERSTLALAFFLAQIEQDPSYKDMIVVFDDPFTSQDRFRRKRTQRLISSTHAQCKQVLVFSHDPLFLRLIYDNHPKAEVRTLQVARVGADDAAIAEWDIVEATKNDFEKLYFEIDAFVQNNIGAPRDVAGKIRLVLEGILKQRFPTAFGEKEWLGDFLNKIREAAAGEPLATMQGLQYDELDELNDYSKQYHHFGNPTGYQTAEINDTELTGYCRRTLKFVGGY